MSYGSFVSSDDSRSAHISVYGDWRVKASGVRRSTTSVVLDGDLGSGRTRRSRGPR